jgi:hypothetical protein
MIVPGRISLILLKIINIEVTEPQLPETATQIRASGRKRKSRADDDFEQY